MKSCNKAAMGSTGGAVNPRAPRSQLPYPKNLISDIVGKYCDMELSAEQMHIAKLNGRLCGTKRPHSVSEQPNFYQSLQSNPYNDSSHPSGGE